MRPTQNWQELNRQGIKKAAWIVAPFLVLLIICSVANAFQDRGAENDDRQTPAARPTSTAVVLEPARTTPPPSSSQPTPEPTTAEPPAPEPPAPPPAEEPPPPPPPAEPPPPPPAADCHPSYTGACVPVGVEDVDCEGGSGNGPAYVRGPVYIVGPDVYDLDGNDNDGVGCEP